MSIKELKTPEGYTIVLDVKDAIVRVGDAWVPVGERLRELEAEVLRLRARLRAATDADPVLAKMLEKGGGEG